MDELLKNKIFATHAIAAAGSVTLGTAVTYPLDSIKVLIQVGSGPNKQLNTSQVIDRVRTLSGNSGLYSGFGWLALGRTVGLGARFGTYEVLTAFCKDGREDNFVHVSEAFMAGLAAGAIESLVSSPFELIKLRAQVTSASRIPSSTAATKKAALAPFLARLLPGYSPDTRALNQFVGLLSTLTSKRPDMVGALREYPWMMTGSGRPPSVCDVKRPVDIISFEGWGALWRGLRSGIVRDSVFGGIFFSSWQFLHRVMLDWKAVNMDPPPRFDEEIGPLSPLSVSLAAGFSGSVAAAASHCFDTARSRTQCLVLPKYLSMERKLLKWRLPGKRLERLTGIHPADRNILFRGVWLRVARSGIASFIIVGSYFVDGREDNFVHVSEAFMAGLAAGAIESLVSSPFELIKLRAQVTSASRIPSSTATTKKAALAPFLARLLPGYSPDTRALNQFVGLLSTLTSKRPDMVGALREYPWMMTGSGRPPSVCDVKRPVDIISFEGWGALWRGLRSGIVRDSVFGGIFFSSWQFLHRAMLDWKAVNMDPPPRFDEEIGPLSPLSVSLATGFSGSVAAAASHCFDTARSRTQCLVLPKYLSMERKLLKWRLPGKRLERLTGIHPADRNILFRGVWLRVARSGIASFIIVGSYFVGINHLVPK